MSSDVGIKVRLSRMLSIEDGAAIVVAVDHGVEGRPQGLESLLAVLPSLLEPRIDGILLNTGALRQCVNTIIAAKHRPAIIVALDMHLRASLPGARGDGDFNVTLATITEAVRLGADAVKLLLAFGQKDIARHAYNLERVAATIEAAHTWGLPVMVETVGWGSTLTADNSRSPELVADMIRVGWEVGADVLKVQLPRTADSARDLVSQCPVPVFLLGGSRADDEQVLSEAATGIAAGVKGLVFGRNIWQNRDPTDMIGRLRKVIRDSTAI